MALPPAPRLPITFAHRGARADVAENTLPAFSLALRLGATGLESDVWRSADGIVVLDHDGRVGFGWRRRPISRLRREALPPNIPALADLYAECGTGFELSLDLKDPDAADAVVATAAAAGPEATGRLWLCHPDVDLLAAIRRAHVGIRLVYSTSLKALTVAHPGEEVQKVLAAAASAAADAGLDALNLRADQWDGARVEAVHTGGLLAFGWDAQRTVTIERLLAAGIDGMYSDHVARMVAAVSHRKTG